MEDIYVNDILDALQEMKEETNSNEDDITLGWAITAIENSIKMQDEIDALKAELKQLEKSNASKEQSSIDYYGLYIKLKAENKALKERLNVQELTVNEFIEELAWRDVQWAAEASGMSSEACGQPSRGAISTYRKSYDKFYEECKQFAEARLKELKGEKE